jgi:hypothetical protein
MVTHCPANNTIFKLTRLKRVPKQTIFSDLVMQLITEFKAVHFKAITLKEAIKKDASKWLKAFVSELQSLKDTNTYRIVNTLNRKKVIISK